MTIQELRSQGKFVDCIGPCCENHDLIESLLAEVTRLDARLNSPEIHDFADAIVREAAHQREQWGTEHDEGKSPSDWLWLVAYLATKATQAERYDDQEKYLHHIIAAAAACCNWHAAASGMNTEMKPGAPEPVSGRQEQNDG